MPPPTSHMPSDADLGRPVIVHLYSLGTFICMGTTIQEVDSDWVHGYIYLEGTCI